MFFLLQKYWVKAVGRCSVRAPWRWWCDVRLGQMLPTVWSSTESGYLPNLHHWSWFCEQPWLHPTILGGYSDRFESLRVQLVLFVRHNVIFLLLGDNLWTGGMSGAEVTCKLFEFLFHSIRCKLCPQWWRQKKWQKFWKQPLSLSSRINYLHILYHSLRLDKLT